MASDRRLVLMTRFPEPGKVKTRLIPTLGERGAAELQRRMTERTLAVAGQASSETGLEIEICFTGGSEGQMRAWLGPDARLRRQVSGDLGQRLRQVAAAAFDEGVTALVIVGTDSPDLDQTHLLQAFEQLVTNDVVLGPAEDGGYYLIGIGRPIDELFRGIPWSTDQVRTATLAVATGLGLTIAELAMLRDVDRPEDLAHVPPELLSGITRR